MEIHKIELYSNATNHAIIRPPGRKLPGSVIQGDTLGSLFSSALKIAKSAKQMEIKDEDFLAEIDDLTEMLFERIIYYQKVLDEHDIELPYSHRFTENDYIQLTPENNDDIS